MSPSTKVAASPSKLLVVEDEWVVARDIERALTAGGHDVCEVVMDPSRLQDAIREHRPDLALVDVRLRSHDGIALVGGLPSTEAVPVVYVTGCADLATITRAASGRCVGFVVKPFTHQQLLATVETSLLTMVERDAAAPRSAEHKLAQIAALLDSARPPPRPRRVLVGTEPLSPREREVLDVLVDQGRAARVARALHISLHTAKNHIRSIYAKLGVHTRDELLDRVLGSGSRPR